MNNKDQSLFWNRPAWRLLAPLALVALVSALFIRQFASGFTVAQITMEGASQWNPFWTFARSELARGHFPLWTPHSLGGWSFPGFPHTAPFYPLGFLFYLFPYEKGTTYSIWFHLCLTSLLMYRFLRAINTGRFASFVGSMLWATGGQLLAYMNFVPLLWTVSWTPLFFDAAYRWMTQRRASQLALLAAVGAIQLLGGSVESLFFEGVALVLATVFFMPEKLKENPGLIVGLVSGIIVTAFLSSIELLPAIEQASLSVRSQGIAFHYFSVRGVPLQFWLLLPSPFDISKMLKAKWEGQFFTPSYMGVLVLIFAVYSLIPGKLRDAKNLRIGLLTFVLALLLTRDLPILSQIMYRIPLMNLFREPGYDLFVPQFLLIILTSRGIDRLFKTFSSDEIVSGDKEKMGSSQYYIGFSIAGVAAIAALLAGARTVWSPQKQYILAIWMGLMFLAAFFALKYIPRRLKQLLVLGVFSVLMLDNWSLAWSYLPNNPPGYLDADSTYRKYFAGLPSYERHIVLDKYGPITRDLPQHAGMLINSQTLDGWEGLPNLRFIEFLNLLDDRSIRLESNKLYGVGYHIIFREGRFVNPDQLPYLNLAGVRYLVAHDFPLKFSSPASLVDALQLFKIDPPGLLTEDRKPVGARLLKTLSLKAGGQAVMTYHVTSGDSLKFDLCSEGAITGLFEIAIRDAEGDPEKQVFSKAFEGLICPGQSMTIDLSLWYGKTVDFVFRAKGDGGGRVLLVQPEMVNKGKLLQRVVNNSIDIYSNSDAFPRAFMIHRAASSKGMEESIAWLKVNKTLLKNEAPIEHVSMTLPPFQDYNINRLAERENVIISEYTPDRVALYLRVLAPGYCILTDTWYPGWTALVDGFEKPIKNAYVTFRAVPIPRPGKYRVEMIYKPISFKIGLWTTIAALISLVFGMVIVLKKGREAA